MMRNQLRHRLYQRTIIQHQIRFINVSRYQNDVKELHTNPSTIKPIEQSIKESNTKEEQKYKPGWFSRHPGITLGGILFAIGLYIYRGTQNKKNFTAIQSPIADAAVISPYEAWELRSKNAITPEIFDSLRNGLYQAFPTGKAEFMQFDQYLGWKLMQTNTKGLQMAHHLERVFKDLEQQLGTKELDLDALLVAFSLIVKGSSDDRLKCLYNIYASDISTDNLVEKDHIDAENKEHAEVVGTSISQAQIERLLSLILLTSQIPSEKRVLPIEDKKYPLQEYEEATASKLLSTAIQAQVEGKKITQEEANQREIYTFDAFAEIMKGKVVCVWGECFSNAKKKMKN